MTRTNPTDKIEWLIDEARKAKTVREPSGSQVESEKKETTGETKVEGGTSAPKGSLKEEILVTLTETSKELSRIIGILIDEREAAPSEPQILPRYCCYCGRDLLPNSLYCDQCGAGVKEV